MKFNTSMVYNYVHESSCLKFSHSTKFWQGKASANQHTRGASDKIYCHKFYS